MSQCLPYPSGPPGTFTRCTACGKAISFGSTLLELARHVTRHDVRDSRDRPVATVLESTPLASLCAGCSNLMSDRKLVLAKLKEALGFSPGCIAAEVVQDRNGTHNTCQTCGIALQFGSVHVSLERLIGQVDRDGDTGVDIITPIDGEEVISFCAECGEAMGVARLRNAVDWLLASLASGGLSGPQRVSPGDSTTC